jgi:hypothetical protein
MTIDAEIPFTGPCAFCDHPDSRHRLWDAIQDRAKAGETILELAADYDLSAAAIEAIIARGET